MKKDSKLFRVWSSNWSMNIRVENFFDDPYTEACTRCIETKLSSDEENINVSPIMMCKCLISNEQITLNTYKILINGGFHEKAEYLRENFFDSSDIDLASEPLSSSIKIY